MLLIGEIVNHLDFNEAGSIALIFDLDDIYTFFVRADIPEEHGARVGTHYRQVNLCSASFLTHTAFSALSVNTILDKAVDRMANSSPFEKNRLRVGPRWLSKSGVAL